MAIYIESRYNDGYMAHHARDMIMVNIHHRPEDGYFLSADKEVIKERIELKEFIIRLHEAEGDPHQPAKMSDVEKTLYEIHKALADGKVRAISDWLDHRYMSVIRNGRAVLIQHQMSMNQFHRETISNSERTVTQSSGWDTERVMKEIDRQGFKVQPMTPDEAYRVCDDEIYYLMTP